MASQKNWKNEDCDAEKSPAEASSPSAPSMIFADPLRVNVEEKRILSPASEIATAPRFGKTEIEPSVSDDSVMLRRPVIGIAPRLDTAERVSDASVTLKTPVIGAAPRLDAAERLSEASVTLKTPVIGAAPSVETLDNVSDASLMEPWPIIASEADPDAVSADSVAARNADSVMLDAETTVSDASVALSDALMFWLELPSALSVSSASVAARDA
jgi:hypothetical protein